MLGRPCRRCAILEAAAPGPIVVTVGRVVTGLGVGFASTVAPLYAVESAPKWLRGRFVSAYQLAITVDIFLAYQADDALTGSGRRRVMFAIAVIPGALLVIGFLLMPESARWLLKMGRRDEARATLARLEGKGVDDELRQIETDLEAERGAGEATWREVFAPWLRRPLMISLWLAVIQQATGINAPARSRRRRSTRSGS